ncbi:MAG: tetratricopeptide repeat protein, partial [Planctomycetota bacterium]
FIMLLPTSSVIPLRETMVYYRLYLPGLGFYLFIVVGVHELFCYFHERKGYSLELVRRLELAVLFCIVVFYGACAHEHNKAWSTEITLWKDTVKKSPNKISSHYALGRAYQINGRIKEAMEEYLTCQELYANAPNIMDTRERKYSSSALNNLGFFYTGMKKYDKAIDILKKAIEINPMNANAHNNLGYAYLNMDRPEVAETKFNRAIEINPEHPRAHAHLAEVYESKGMPGQALSAYTKAVSVRSTNVAAWMRLGQLWLSYKKDPTRALQCLQEAQKVCKNEETLAEIKDIIGTIEGSGRAVPTPETGKSTD